jgi:tetratricopeptide (TPR) repeat protein
MRADRLLRHHHMALNTARHTSDRIAEAGALTDLGGMQQLTENYPAAVTSFTRALELYRDLDSRLGEAGALDGLGAVQYLTTDYRAATASLTRALWRCSATPETGSGKPAASTGWVSSSA